MKKNIKLKRSATSGRFVIKPVGKVKAAKFAQVEGITTSLKSASVLEAFAGLQGDALRSAITGSFVNSKGK